jgi:polynucleotide 5'-kinase involved in rRNA processing
MIQLELSITQIRQTMKDMTAMKVDCISDQALTQLKNLLRDGQDTLNEFAQDRILRGIKAGFEDMSYRYQNINNPFQDTFEWVLDLNGESVEATKFTQWLSSGDGIFHICGKLGSGKSTLSK